MRHYGLSTGFWTLRVMLVTVKEVLQQWVHLSPVSTTAADELMQQMVLLTPLISYLIAFTHQLEDIGTLIAHGWENASR